MHHASECGSMSKVHGNKGGGIREMMHVATTNHCLQGNGIGERGARELARVFELKTRITHLNVAVCSRELERRG